MVESKSLKLYLFSFRNHGDFHEDCVNIIMEDLIRLMDPRYIEVWGKFTPRGGISMILTATTANRGQNGKRWPGTVWPTMTCIRKRSTTAERSRLQKHVEEERMER